jgi:hypothetical protein
MGDRHTFTFPWSGSVLVNCQNKFLLLSSAGTGFSNYDAVNMPGKVCKPRLYSYVLSRTRT